MATNLVYDDSKSFRFCTEELRHGFSHVVSVASRTSSSMRTLTRKTRATSNASSRKGLSLDAPRFLAIVDINGHGGNRTVAASQIPSHQRHIPIPTALCEGLLSIIQQLQLELLHTTAEISSRTSRLKQRRYLSSGRHLLIQASTERNPGTGTPDHDHHNESRTKNSVPPKRAERRAPQFKTSH